MSHDPHANPDQFRRTPEPCVHTWRWIDSHDLWFCTTCKTTEADDDDPGDAA